MTYWLVAGFFFAALALSLVLRGVTASVKIVQSSDNKAVIEQRNLYGESLGWINAAKYASGWYDAIHGDRLPKDLEEALEGNLGKWKEVS